MPRSTQPLKAYNVPQTIAIYTSEPPRARSLELSLQIRGRFEARGFEVIDYRDERVWSASLLVAIGGDGTLLGAARIAIEHDLPVLGINTGRLGFLTEFDDGDPRIDLLPQAVEAGLVFEERAALEAHYAGRSFFALNDVVVRKAGVSRIVPFGLRMNGEHVADVPADGICIATPTGSTAYFLSAGGPIISPNVDAFGIVPLLPHTLFSRPIIVPASSRIEIACNIDLAQAHLECDGEGVAEISSGHVVVIMRHPKTVRFARVDALRFFSRLEEKLRWGVSIRATSLDGSPEG